MSLKETSNLIAQSRKIIESGQDETTNSNALLNIIPHIVTSIGNRVQRMETNIEKRIDDLDQYMLSVASRVNTLENRSNELKAKLTECKSSYKGVSNLFDQVEKQCKTNTRNIINFDSRIKKLEEKPVVQPVIQPAVESEEIKSLKESVLNLKNRPMKNILILTGLNRVQNEDTDDLLRGFLHHEFEINYRIEFGNVHRSKARTGDNSDLKFALNNGNKLRGKPFGIREQFQFEIEHRRNLFYPRVDKNGGF
jgi:DNA repair exonuclease SbcCD ATPase subunit